MRLPENYKKDWSACVPAFTQLSAELTAHYAQNEAQASTKKKTENIRQYTLRSQQFFEKCWCNEFAATINLKCNEIFTQGLTEKLKDFAHKRQGKLNMRTLLSNITITLRIPGKFVDAEDLTNEKVRTFDLTLENIDVRAKLESQIFSSEIYDPNPEYTCTQTTDPRKE